MKTFRETALLLSAALFLTACDKEAVQETGPSGSVSGRKVEMTFGLSASGMTSPAAFIPVTAKAAGADEALVLETGAQEPLTRGASLSGDEEGKLHGLWVLQFDNTTSAGKLVLREYHAAGEIQNDKLSVALYDAAATKVYFVANVADDKFSSLPLNTTTLGAFETSVLDFAGCGRQQRQRPAHGGSLRRRRFGRYGGYLPSPHGRQDIVHLQGRSGYEFGIFRIEEDRSEKRVESDEL